MHYNNNNNNKLRLEIDIGMYVLINLSWVGISTVLPLTCY